MHAKADGDSIADEAAAFLEAIRKLDEDQQQNLAFVIEEAINLALQLDRGSLAVGELRASNIA